MKKGINKQRHPDVVNGTMKLLKNHSTTAMKGDVSCMQCKAFRRNLQDLKRNAEFFSEKQRNTERRSHIF